MGTTTPIRGLYKPAHAEVGWDGQVNGNFDNLDTTADKSYVDAQVATAAPVASPTFTGTVTLPATVKGTAAADMTIEVPVNQTLLLQDQFTRFTFTDSIALGPADGAGNEGGITLTGCLGSILSIDGGGNNGNGTEIAMLMPSNGASLAVTPTQVVIASPSGVAALAVGPGNAIEINPGLFTVYNGLGLVDGGVPYEIAHANLTAQTALKAATTLATPSATGRFRVSAYLKVTTAATSSSVLGGVTITFTDGTDSVAQSITMALQTQAGVMGTTNAGNSTVTNLSGQLYIFAQAGIAIKYAIAYTSSGVTPMAYEAHLTLEAL